jgi:chemotaxis protein CheD
VTSIVGISDAKASRDPREVLATYSLGSCIGVALYDPAAGVAGLLHYQLPASSADPARAAEKPLMFADTGMKWLLQRMAALGAEKRRMKVKLAGAAQMLNDLTVFDIGRRNHAAIRKILWQNEMFIESEHVGGRLPRSMFLNVGDGSLEIRCNQESFTV